ncbi:MAG: hypothetical protein ACI902_002395 [Psychroserpens sp.]|jgi:hypothetical protein
MDTKTIIYSVATALILRVVITIISKPNRESKVFDIKDS